MITPSLRFTDSCAEVILDVLNPDGETNISERVLLVAGALRRQLIKRYGSEDVSLLSSEIVDQAYWNEVARVVRSWPQSRDFLRPTEFFTTAQILRSAMSLHGFCDSRTDLCGWNLPHVLDDRRACVVVFDTPERILFACPTVLGKMSLAFEDVIDSITSLDLMIHPDERDRFARVRDTLLDGLPCDDSLIFRTIVPFEYKFKIEMFCTLKDDDCRYVGNLIVTRALSEKSDTRDMLVIADSSRLDSRACERVHARYARN